MQSSIVSSLYQSFRWLVGMAPNPKVVAAYRAMANLGIHESKVKPVLKKLLKLYDKNWELIEEENYRALADAIFEEEENPVPEQEQEKKNKRVDEAELDDEVQDQPLRPKKRLRLRGPEFQSSNNQISCGPSSAAFPLKTPKLEDDTVPGNGSILHAQSAAALSDGNGMIEAHQVHSQDDIIDKGKKPVSPQVTPRGRRSTSDGVPPAVLPKEPAVEPLSTLSPRSKMAHPLVWIKPKDEPIDDARDNEAPISMILPEPSSGKDSSMMNGAAGQQDCDDTVASHCLNDEVAGEDNLRSSNEDAPSTVEIGSSPVQEEGSAKITPNISMPKESESHDALVAGGNEDLVTPCISNGSANVNSHSSLPNTEIPVSLPCSCGLDDTSPVPQEVGNNDCLASDDGRELVDPISNNSHSLVTVPKNQLTTNAILTVHDVNDISKGEEKVKISWVNNITDDFPPSFHYIPRNLVFQNAYVSISLSRIGNEDCCSTCIGNCVLSSESCSCANKTGGGFAYTAQGLLKEEFLDECIVISCNPKNCFYCEDCPVERSKNDDCSEPCKGHLRRKFIKECWSKCGCGKKCGNRVVQRGITCNLQVFLTSEGKGWGLRTLEDLPKGAFVCEFVGEILTVKELHERSLKYPKNRKYTYPILLDADWESGGVGDKEALCLYAASYGNAARFINHRCLDANLIEIPVEIEGPDHHYYHLALFTSREIAAQEELTWDYGINFDDHDQPVELFGCKCGSKFCRNMKRSSRSARSLAAR
ncbi:hypothetical protein S83_017944 [Arachis hypogaea]